ncbi:MAG TPA: hypothetical protein VHW43_07205, partial [Puia sp.]|nr:hypothetical protein [Puia sp.]
MFTLLVTAIISLLTGSVYYFARLERVEAFDKRLRSRSAYNAQLFRIMGDSAFSMLRRMDTANTVGTASRSIRVIADDGKVMYRFDMLNWPSFDVSPDLLAEARVKGEKFFTTG